MNQISTLIKTPKIRVDAAIQCAGSQANLAKWLGLHRASVSMWKKRALVYVPDAHAFRLEKLHPDLVESGSESPEVSGQDDA
jgi:hypothetical protein